MGKYLYSFGKAGLWEASRPLIWPFVLGLFWKLNLDVVFYSRLIEMLFATGCIYFTYLIGKDIFNEKVALLSAFFVAFSSTFFTYTTATLAGIPSLFFGLAAVYYFIKKNYFLAGIFSSLSFMTRFVQIGIFLILLLFLLSRYGKKNYFINRGYFLSGFVLIFFPYLLFNYFKYGGFFYPFFLQTFLTKYTGWMYYQPFWFYFFGLFQENFLFIFSILGLFLIIKKKRYKNNIVLLIFSLFFLFFTLIKHKEMRFVITFLPYLSLVVAYGMCRFLNKFRSRITKKIIFIIFLSLFLIQFSYNLKVEEKIDYSFFNNQINKETFEKNIWISNPTYIVNSDKKAKLIYYPAFNSKKMNELREEISDANLILINTCDIPCPPSDKVCFNEKPLFIDELKNRFKIVDYELITDCEKIILKK